MLHAYHGSRSAVKQRSVRDVVMATARSARPSDHSARTRLIEATAKIMIDHNSTPVTIMKEELQNDATLKTCA